MLEASWRECVLVVRTCTLAAHLRPVWRAYMLDVRRCVRACVFACVLGRSRVRAGPWCVRGGLLISMLRVCARVLTFCLLTKYACVYNATTVVVTGALQEKAEVMLSFGFVFVHLSGP